MTVALQPLIVTRPVEIHQLHIKPVDFFEGNPAIDVPSNGNKASVLTNGTAKGAATGLTNSTCCE